MIALLLVIAGLTATGVLMLMRSGTVARQAATDLMRTQDAERILEQCFARGEVDQDEFQLRKNALRSNVKP